MQLCWWLSGSGRVALGGGEEEEGEEEEGVTPSVQLAASSRRGGCGSGARRPDLCRPPAVARTSSPGGRQTRRPLRRTGPGNAFLDGILII